MWMTIGEQRFAITLADNAAAGAFAKRLPLTLDMSDLNRNEKHASLPENLPADASKPGQFSIIANNYPSPGSALRG
jgi:hypothetical protein